MQRTETDAEKAGYEAGRNGANTDNCHFSYFTTPELTKAWERGNTRGQLSPPRIIGADFMTDILKQFVATANARADANRFKAAAKAMAEDFDRRYASAVNGRAAFRTALRKERDKTKRLLTVIGNFANEKNWSDKPANLRWDGKRHAVEYAQSVIAEEQ